MNDIRISSWNELSEVLYDIPPDPDHGRHRSNYVYRGVANKEWRLETSLRRLGNHCAAVEGPLLRNFKKYAELGTIPPGNLWLKLAVAQHHGLPTRVLDWTVAPKVAVHFATFEQEHYDKDGAIWRINVAESRKLLPPLLLDVLRKEYAYIFSVEMLDFIQDLDAFDELGAKQPFVLFFEPPSLDGRIINQWAIMSVMSSPMLVLDEFLKDQTELYDRIIIPAELKWEIRDKLDQDNVTERMLFPGLDGLSKWLKRYYSSKGT
ncbi:MAG TPA: FRG domain-containing protein [Thermoanaerobaculia bacterium]|jgi:hypothetical protein